MKDGTKTGLAECRYHINILCMTVSISSKQENVNVFQSAACNVLFLPPVRRILVLCTESEVDRFLLNLNILKKVHVNKMSNQHFLTQISVSGVFNGRGPHGPVSFLTCTHFVPWD